MPWTVLITINWASCIIDPHNFDDLWWLRALLKHICFMVESPKTPSSCACVCSLNRKHPVTSPVCCSPCHPTSSSSWFPLLWLSHLPVFQRLPPPSAPPFEGKIYKKYIWSRPPSLHPPPPPHGLGPQVAAPLPFYLQAIGSISEVQLRIC